MKPMGRSKKKPKELSIKQEVMIIKQYESEGKSHRELAKISTLAKLKYRMHFQLERDVTHLLTTLSEIEKGLCEMSTNALRQKSIRDLFNSSD